MTIYRVEWPEEQEMIYLVEMTAAQAKALRARCSRRGAPCRVEKLKPTSYSDIVSVAMELTPALVQLAEAAD